MSEWGVESSFEIEGLYNIHASSKAHDVFKSRICFSPLTHSVLRETQASEDGKMEIEGEQSRMTVIYEGEIIDERDTK